MPMVDLGTLGSGNWGTTLPIMCTGSSPNPANAWEEGCNLIGTTFLMAPLLPLCPLLLTRVKVNQEGEVSETPEGWGNLILV